MNVTDPIRRQARLTPDAPAVIRPDGGTVTHGELDRMIDAQARRARDIGLVPGDVATMNIAGEHKFPLFVLALGLARIGVASAPATLPEGRVKVRFAEPGAAAGGKAEIVALEGGWVENSPSEPDRPPVPSHQDASAVCRIFYTSGTTGIPKYVALDHGVLMRRITERWLALRPPDDPRQIFEVGLGTAYSLHCLLPVLWFGGLVVLPPHGVTSTQLVALIDRHRVNSLVISPGALASLITSLPPEDKPLPSLETMEVSGSLLPAPVYEIARRRVCANIVIVYGATEMGAIASAPAALLSGRPGSVGYLHPGYEAEAVDENDIPLPPGTEGVLRLRSENAIAGYLDDPAASAAVFKKGWFYPGDLGSVSPEGLLTVAGRTGDVINQGGHKVNPALIEDVLLSLEGIREAAAFGAPGPLGITQIWAAIVPDKPMDNETVFAHCNPRLRESAPRYIMQVDALPRNESGKVLRDELRRIAAAVDLSKVLRS